MTDDVIDVESTVTPATDQDATVADLTPARIDHGALVTAAAPMADIVEAFNEYQELTNKLLVKEDYQPIEGKNFKKKSAYRKLAVAFGVSFKIVDRSHTVDEVGRVIRSEFVVTAIAPNGREADGYGACSIFDRCKSHFGASSKWPCPANCTKHCGGREGGCDGFHHFSKPEHDVPATAETRAKNRAASDLFGMGEVSAEEVDTGDSTMRKATWDEIADVQAAAKALRAAGFTGDLGNPRNLLGVELVELWTDEASGEKMQSIVATAQQVGELAAKITGLRAGLEDAASAGSVAPTPSGDAQEAAQRQGEGAQSPSSEAAPPSDSPDAGDGSVPVEAPGVAGDGVVEGGVAGDAAPGKSTAPDPAPPDEEATAGQRQKLAIAVKQRWPEEPNASLARGAVVDVVTAGRSRSSKDLTKNEAGVAIRVAKALLDGNLGFGVVPEKGDDVLLDEGIVPTEAQTPTLFVTMPEGGSLEPGQALLTELAALQGVTV